MSTSFRSTDPKAAIILLGILFSCLLWSCETKDPPRKAEPHLELGQTITFQGSDPDCTYTILGYREEADSPTEKTYRGQHYIVYFYMNSRNDILQSVIHKNSIIKK